MAAIAWVAATAVSVGEASVSSQLACELSTSGWSLKRSDGSEAMGGDAFAVHMRDRWWAWPPSNRTAGQLRALRRATSTGSDDIGHFEAVSLEWGLGGASKQAEWVIGCRYYSDIGAAVFTSVGIYARHPSAIQPTSCVNSRFCLQVIPCALQAFPNGADDTAVSGASADDGVLSNFPMATRIQPELGGLLSWAGEFVRPVRGNVPTGVAGGPVVFFDDKHDPPRVSALVGSPLNHFKAYSAASSAFDGRKARWVPGTTGTAIRLPTGFSHEWIVFTPSTQSRGTVTAAMDGYGTLMRQLHKTYRVTTDVTVTHLQYQTDNGAQYCFCKTQCDAKLLDVKRGLERSDGPRVRSLSFQGGWWDNPRLHTAAAAPWCVTSWEPNTSKFPSGVTFHTDYGGPFQLYAPYFCMDTPYSEKWPMLSSDISLSGCSGAPAFAFKTPRPEASHAFYRWFMAFGKKMWGMTSFEPDFLHQNFVCVPEFLENVTAMKIWADGMAAAAHDEGLAMQWCMATPSDVLLALDYPALTNFRVSTDYFYGASYDIGLGSLLVWALGARPSKDTFWTSDQSDVAKTLGGCPGSGCPADHGPHGAVLHTMLAVLSTGPVGFSDAANRTNVTLLWPAALADGTLIQPSRPATALDAVLGSSWSGGYVLGTYSGSISTTPWGWYILGHQLGAPFAVNPERDLYPGPEAGTSLLWRQFHFGNQCSNGSSIATCARKMPPVLAAASTAADVRYKPELWSVSRVCASGWALLGVISKYASLSEQLFAAVECRPDGGLRVEIASFATDLLNITLAEPCPIGPARVLVVQANAGQVLNFGSHFPGTDMLITACPSQKVL